MDIRDIAVPDIYKSSSDFRLFIEIFADSLAQIQYDTENLIDCYDPLRCKSELLWMLGETIGYKLDDRLPIAFNRLVLLYFMSLIRNKGSKDGVILAAQINLAQFNILEYGKENEILYDRLEDTSIPVNSAAVTSHTEDGYIDIVYVSEEIPIDSCIEYVRPLGMYVFQSAGVHVDARSKISVDARLMNENNNRMSIGPTHTGHYSRADYARMQIMNNDNKALHDINTNHKRRQSYYRNSDINEIQAKDIDSGYRTLYSLQLCNNEHIIKSIWKSPIFSLGYGPQDVITEVDSSYLKIKDEPAYNLRLNRTMEKRLSKSVFVNEVDDSEESKIPITPVVNPIMGNLGDAMLIDDKYNLNKN